MKRRIARNGTSREATTKGEGADIANDIQKSDAKPRRGGDAIL
jgi:hypothetical protein